MFVYVGNIMKYNKELTNVQCTVYGGMMMDRGTDDEGCPNIIIMMLGNGLTVIKGHFHSILTNLITK